MCMQYKRFAYNNLLINFGDQYVEAIVHKCLTFPRYFFLRLLLFSNFVDECQKYCIGTICDRWKM
jgi:hypothetical protein